MLPRPKPADVVVHSPDAVQRQDRRRLERRGKERRCRVALVVIGEQQLLFPVDAVVDLQQMVAQHGFLEQLLLQPDRDRLAERLKAARRKGEIGLEQALEFEKRLFVEHHMIDVGRRQLAGRQAVANRGSGKARVVLPPRKALLLRRGDDLAVHSKAAALS